MTSLAIAVPTAADAATAPGGPPSVDMPTPRDSVDASRGIPLPDDKQPVDMDAQCWSYNLVQGAELLKSDRCTVVLNDGSEEGDSHKGIVVNKTAYHVFLQIDGTGDVWGVAFDKIQEREPMRVPLKPAVEPSPGAVGDPASEPEPDSEPELMESSRLGNLADREGALDVESLVKGSLVYYKFARKGSIELSGTVVSVDKEKGKLVVYHNSPRDGESKGHRLVLPISKVLSFAEPIPESVTRNLKIFKTKEARVAQLECTVGDVVIVVGDDGAECPVTIMDMRRAAREEHYGAMKVLDEDEEVVCWVDNVLRRNPRVTRSLGAPELLENVPPPNTLAPSSSPEPARTAMTLKIVPSTTEGASVAVKFVVSAPQPDMSIEEVLALAEAADDGEQDKTRLERWKSDAWVAVWVPPEQNSKFLHDFVPASDILASYEQTSSVYCEQKSEPARAGRADLAEGQTVCLQLKVLGYQSTPIEALVVNYSSGYHCFSGRAPTCDEEEVVLRLKNGRYITVKAVHILGITHRPAPGSDTRLYDQPTIYGAPAAASAAAPAAAPAEPDSPVPEPSDTEDDDDDAQDGSGAVVPTAMEAEEEEEEEAGGGLLGPPETSIEAGQQLVMPEVAGTQPLCKPESSCTFSDFLSIKLWATYDSAYLLATTVALAANRDEPGEVQVVEQLRTKALDAHRAWAMRRDKLLVKRAKEQEKVEQAAAAKAAKEAERAAKAAAKAAAKPAKPPAKPAKPPAKKLGSGLAKRGAGPFDPSVPPLPMPAYVAEGAGKPDTGKGVHSHGKQPKAAAKPKAAAAAPTRRRPKRKAVIEEEESDDEAADALEGMGPLEAVPAESPSLVRPTGGGDDDEVLEAEEEEEEEEEAVPEPPKKKMMSAAVALAAKVSQPAGKAAGKAKAAAPKAAAPKAAAPAPKTVAEPTKPTAGSRNLIETVHSSVDAEAQKAATVAVTAAAAQGKSPADQMAAAEAATWAAMARVGAFAFLALIERVRRLCKVDYQAVLAYAINDLWLDQSLFDVIAIEGHAASLTQPEWEAVVAVATSTGLASDALDGIAAERVAAAGGSSSSGGAFSSATPKKRKKTADDEEEDKVTPANAPKPSDPGTNAPERKSEKAKAGKKLKLGKGMPF